MLYRYNKKIWIYVLLMLPIITALSIYPSLAINMITLRNTTYGLIVSSVVLSSLLLIAFFYWLESSLRSSLSSMLTHALFDRKNSLDEMDKIESVNYTSAIEKYTWSLADTIKFGSMMLGSLILLTISSWKAAMASVTILIAIYLSSKFLLGKIISTRRMLELYAKNIVKTIKNISSKSFFFNKTTTQEEIKQEVKEALYNYTYYRMRITYYRSLVAIAATIYASILISCGVLLLNSSLPLGLLFITVWFFSKDGLERLIDAYIVNLSEAIHAERIYNSANDRDAIVRIDRNALNDLKAEGSTLYIYGPNGSGKSLLLREIYFLAPEKTKYYDSRFFLKKNALVDILKNMEDGETVIFDEAICNESYPWLFDYFEKEDRRFKNSNNNVMVVAHGIDENSINESAKKISIWDVRNLLIN